MAALRERLAASHFEDVLSAGPGLFREARDREDWPTASEVALAIGRACSNLGAGDEALRWTHESALAAQRVDDPERECLAWSQLAAEHGRHDRLAQAIEALDEVSRRLLGVTRPAALRELLSSSAATYYGLGLCAAALQLYERALQIAEQEGDLGERVTVRTNWLIVAHSEFRNLSASEDPRTDVLLQAMHDHLERLRPEVSALGADRARWRLAFVTGSVLIDSGRMAEAAVVLQELLDTTPALPAVLVSSIWVSLARARRASGDGAGAMEAARAAERAADGPGSVPRSYDLMRRADIAELLGRTEEALALFKRYHHRTRQVLVGAIQARLDQSLARMAEMQALIENRELRQRNEGLAAGVEHLSILAATDPLTGLFNRRGFDEACQRLGPALAGAVVVLLDLDRFKQVNDLHGHAAGDAVLRQVARLLASGLRDGDLIARHGGEEFVLLLRGLQGADVATVLSRMRELLAAHDWSTLVPEGAVTVSGGAVRVGVAEALADALARADRLLYSAKQAGRDRIVLDLPEDRSC